MSILIKGMEMPQTCSECGFYHHREDDSYYDYEVCSAINMIIGDRYPHPNEKNRYNVYEISCKRRHERCPLIEVPEDVQPVKHGRWVFYKPPDDWIKMHLSPKSFYVCDICGHIEDGKQNYCSHCGAKMDGET